jgi:Asp-tRNA(Asn)/Glu-tRNA(Gln) amidotransferase C subunit
MKISESEIKKISKLSALKNQNNNGLTQKFETVIAFISKLD